MTLGSLFAGIGGFELAATWAGITPVWSNEIDPFCCKVLKKNFKHEIIEEDIRSLSAYSSGTRRAGEKYNEANRLGRATEWKETKVLSGRIKIEKVDIISGGFPCQPFSHAGQRKGTDDDRYLWPEMLRVISEAGPSWVVGENVAGLLSMENGKTLDRILTDLEDQGYHTETFLIPACGVGAWHRRDRIWIVCRQKQVDTNQCSSRQAQHSEYKEGLQHNGGGELFSEFSSLGKDVSNTKSQRQSTQQNRPEKFQSQTRQGLYGRGDHSTDIRSNGTTRPAQSRLGDMVDGLPSGMVGYWDREPDIQRVATGVKDRVNKLKGLGNAIVPQVAYEIFKAIIENERSKAT